MSEHADNDRIDDGIGTYDVVLLVEHELSRSDAEQVHGLHEEIADQVVYHVILPMEDAAARIEASMGTLAGGEALAGPVVPLSEENLDEIRRECMEQGQAELGDTLAHLRATGAQAHGTLASGPPVDALAAKVDEVDAREAIVLTSPHVVAEFFHVDWATKARRRLGVPVLHLLEHETFDEQAGGTGEGVTGF